MNEKIALRALDWTFICVSMTLASKVISAIRTFALFYRSYAIILQYMNSLFQTSSPMGSDRSPESQHNVCRDYTLESSNAGNSDLDTVIRPKFKHKILCQF